jgi:hypothetical protein
MQIREILDRTVTEAAGRVVQGVNTTADVGVDEIPRQAAKFRMQVNRDGYPPVARTNGEIPKF